MSDNGLNEFDGFGRQNEANELNGWGSADNLKKDAQGSSSGVYANTNENQTNSAYSAGIYQNYGYGQPYTGSQSYGSYGSYKTAGDYGAAGVYGSNKSSADLAGGSKAGKKKKEKKKGQSKAGKFFKRVAAIVASAALFGAVAGGVMCGVYAIGTENMQSGSGQTDNTDLPQINQIIQSIPTSVITSGDGTSVSMDVKAVAKAALPAMVALEGKTKVTASSGIFGYGQTYESMTSGTGIIVGKNDTELLILTNAHVVEGVSDLKCVFVNETKVDCVVKGAKSDKDIAVVAVNLSEIGVDTLSSIAIAELGDSDSVEIGQQVVAIGNALGEGQSVTNGIISALNRSIEVKSVEFNGLFMTNAAINSGNSGGALLTADGKVIGINFAKTAEDGVEGMAYAIPVSNVRELINSLMNRVTRTKVSESEAGSIGITSGIDITSTMANYYGFPQGVQIRSVLEGSAAQKAGLGKYDIIVSFDEQTVSSMSGLSALLQYYKAGETVAIEYYHIEGNQYILKTVEITLDKKNR